MGHFIQFFSITEGILLHHPLQFVKKHFAGKACNVTEERTRLGDQRRIRRETEMQKAILTSEL